MQEEWTPAKMGAKGGKSRALKLTAEKLTAVAKAGAAARWKDHVKTKRVRRKPV